MRRKNSSLTFQLILAKKINWEMYVLFANVWVTGIYEAQQNNTSKALLEAEHSVTEKAWDWQHDEGFSGVKDSLVF